MPVELQIIRASEFIRLNAKGHLNLQASKEVLALLAHACWKRGLTTAMLDLRAVPIPEKPLFTADEISTLVDSFCGAGFSRKHRLAVVYQSDRHGGARTFASLSRNRGLQVHAFPDFESALLWLSEGQDQLAKPGRKGQAIPIKFAGRKGDTETTHRPNPGR